MNFEVPSDERPHECPHCGRPFRRERLLSLHLGVDHERELTDAERERFADAYDDESDELRLFRLKALVVLVFLYFGLLMVYAVV